MPIPVIVSTRNGVGAVNGYRDDLVAGDLIGLSLSNTVGITTVKWELLGRPEGSTAGGAGPEPILLANAFSAAFTADSDSGDFRLDGTYTVQATLNPGSPGEVRVTTILSRLSGLTIPGAGSSLRTLRKLGGFEALEDTSIPTILQGWATELNRWLELVRETVSGGAGGFTTLAGAYSHGASSSDQTMVLHDSLGGGVIIDGSQSNFTGASALRINTAAGGPVVVDRATGRVGIGIAAPLQQVHVFGTAPAIRLDRSGGAALDMMNVGDELQFINGALVMAKLKPTGGLQADLGVGIGVAPATAAVLALGPASTAPISVSGSARFRYNEVTGHAEFSENGGAYQPFATPIVAYQTIEANGTPLTQRSILNFSPDLAAVDNSGATRTDVSLVNAGAGAGAYGGTGITGLSLDAKGRVTAVTAASLVPTTRNVNTTAPLAGGGALSSDLTLTLSIDGSLGVSGGALQRSALTGDVTAPAGSNVTTLANAGAGAGTYGTAGVTSITIDAQGRVTAVTTATYLTSAFYQTIDVAGTPLTQRNAFNLIAPLTAVDNAGAGRTDVSLAFGAGLTLASGVLIAPGGTGRADGVSVGSVQLVSLPAANLTDGALCWVDSVQDYFRLAQTSFATTPLTVITAYGKAGYQWLRLNAPNLGNAGVANWYIDPVSGNDENNGTSSGTALKTNAEWTRRMTGLTGVATTLNWTLNDIPDADTLTIPCDGTVTIQGSQTVVSTQTVTSAQARTPASNLANEITVTSFNWTPYLNTFLRVQGTTNYAAITKVVGSGVARLGELWNTSVSSQAASGGVTAGQIIEIVQTRKGPLQIIQTGKVSLSINDVAVDGSGPARIVNNRIGSGNTTATRVIVGGTTSQLITGVGQVFFGGLIKSSSFATISGFGSGGTAFTTPSVSFQSAGQQWVEYLKIRSAVFQGSAIVVVSAILHVDGDLGQFDIGAGVNGLSVNGANGVAEGSSMHFNSGRYYGNGSDPTSVAWAIGFGCQVVYNPVTPPVVASGTNIHVEGPSGGGDITFASLPYPMNPWSGVSIVPQGALTSPTAGFLSVSTTPGTTVVPRRLINIDGTISIVNPDGVGGNPIISATVAGGITQLTGDVTAGPGSGSQAATISAHAVSFAKFQQVAALSVVGNATASLADAAAITATTNGQVLQVAGGVLTWAALPYSALTGTPTIFYQTVDQAGSALTQRGALNFSARFAAADNAGAGRTDVELATSGVSAGSYSNANITVDAFGRITVASNGGGATFYQTIQNAGTPVTQRGSWNASTGLTAVDNGGSGRTDVTVNLSTGLSGGQALYGGTAGGEGLHIVSTFNATKGQIYLGAATADFYDEPTGAFSLGTTLSAGGFVKALPTSGKLAIVVESASTLLGNTTGSPAGVQEIGLGTGLGFSALGGGILVNTSPLSALSVTSPLNLSSNVLSLPGAIIYGGPGTQNLGALSTGILLLTAGAGPGGGAGLSTTSAYQTVEQSGSALTQRATLNFSTAFAAADNGGSARTDVDLASPTGDLSGAWPGSTVVAIHETSGPTRLVIGAIPDSNPNATALVRGAGSATVIGVATTALFVRARHDFFVSIPSLQPANTTAQQVATSSPTPFNPGVTTNPIEYPNTDFIATMIMVELDLIASIGVALPINVWATRNGSLISGTMFTFTPGVTGLGTMILGPVATGSTSAGDTYGIQMTYTGNFSTGPFGAQVAYSLRMSLST